MKTEIVIKDASGQPVTTSLAIAEGTKVQHKNVMELVRKYRADLEGFGGVALVTRALDTLGGEQTQQVALLNEHQSALLIAYMRNSEIVRAFKMALVKGFFEMRAALAAPADPFAALPPEQRALVALMCDNVAIKAKQTELATVQIEQADSIKRIEAKQSAIENGASFFTVIGFGVHRGIKFSLADASALGRSASKLSKAAGISIDKVRDPRFGEVNSYHESMLDEALALMHGGM